MQVNLRNLCFALIAVAVVFTSGYAQQQEDKADKTLAPYFVVKGDPSVDQLPLKDTHVDISVSGVIADVKVRQIYRNEGSRPINASYVFPASTRAAVYSMRMQIGNEIIVAKIKEREQAKQEFEQAKEEGKSASLLEQQRPNVFSMSLANIMPQEQVEIELRYTELLVPADNVYEVVFPTVVGPRYASTENGNKKNDKFVETPYTPHGSSPACRFTISPARRTRSTRSGRVRVLHN
jgi:Ca-activated chloride channel family protein